MLHATKFPHPPCEEPPIKAWSFSRLISFEECPYREYLRGVAKVQEPPRDENHPLERGNRIHKEAEEYLNHTRTDLPPSLNKLGPAYEELRAQVVDHKHAVEEPWAFTVEWDQTDWWAKDVWLRLKTDFYWFTDPTSLVLIDHKTGKSWGREIVRAMQGQLYAACAFMRFPELDAIGTTFWYIDEGKRTPIVNYSRAIASQFLRKFTDRAMILTNSTVFPAKPNRHNCNFCPYGRSKGNGHCAYAVE